MYAVLPSSKEVISENRTRDHQAAMRSRDPQGGYTNFEACITLIWNNVKHLTNYQLAMVERPTDLYIILGGDITQTCNNL